ncbi:MAG: hypothetical protein BMS9Abin32_601 [Gammaproteobacteria bacterium]|nr:MAG: hypothetical protein BMS9Abin32_601 [Gammaproteobacteria bacterium]
MTLRIPTSWDNSAWIESALCPQPPRIPRESAASTRRSNKTCRPCVPAARTLLARSLLGAAFFLFAACAVVTEEQRAERMYDREDRLILARESYQQRLVACRRSGGAMQITSYSSARLGRYSARDYKMAQCVAY